MRISQTIILALTSLCVSGQLFGDISYYTVTGPTDVPYGSVADINGFVEIDPDAQTVIDFSLAMSDFLPDYPYTEGAVSGTEYLPGGAWLPSNSAASIAYGILTLCGFSPCDVSEPTSNWILELGLYGQDAGGCSYSSGNDTGYVPCMGIVVDPPPPGNLAETPEPRLGSVILAIALGILAIRLRAGSA